MPITMLQRRFLSCVKKCIYDSRSLDRTTSPSSKFFLAFTTNSVTSTRSMSGKLNGTKRLEGNDENVWTQYTSLAAEYKAVNVGQGFPDFSPPNYVKEALANASAGPNHMLNQYTRGQGHPRLVNAISKLFSPLIGVDINPMTDVQCTTGAYGALFCAFQAFIEEGDEVIIIEPFYDCYKPMTLIAGGTPKYVTLRPKATKGQMTSADWVLDESEVRSAFNSKTKAIVLNNPHNPLGKIYTREELQFIADLCIKHDVLCISDEVYEWLQYGDAKHIRIASLPGMWERTLTVGSAGKTFSVTGWKVGWAIGHANLIKHVSTVWQNSIFHSNTPASEAVAIGIEKEMARMDSDDCYFKSLPRELLAKRDSVAKMLESVGMKPIIPNGGYFMLADISDMKADLGDADETRDSKFVKWMIKTKNLATIPSSAFYSAENKRLGEPYIRICFCKNDETLNAMADILKNW